MNEVNETDIKKIVDKMYKDCMQMNIPDYFLKKTYNWKHFKEIIPNKDAFHTIIGFLPNTNHRGMPFILSVVFNKNNDEYEIVFHNPRLKF